MARLLFFGKLGDLAGKREIERMLPDGVATIAALIDAISKDDAMLASGLRDKSIRYVINEKVESGDAAISDNDEIAFLPPVSGG